MYLSCSSFMSWFLKFSVVFWRICVLKLPLPVFEECSWLASISVSILGDAPRSSTFLATWYAVFDYISKVVFAVADVTEQFSGRLVFKWWMNGRMSVCRYLQLWPTAAVCVLNTADLTDDCWHNITASMMAHSPLFLCQSKWVESDNVALSSLEQEKQ